MNHKLAFLVYRSRWAFITCWVERAPPAAVGIQARGCRARDSAAGTSPSGWYNPQDSGRFGNTLGSSALSGQLNLRSKYIKTRHGTGSQRTNRRSRLLFLEITRILWEIIPPVTMICEMWQRRRRRKRKQSFESGNLDTRSPRWVLT